MKPKPNRLTLVPEPLDDAEQLHALLAERKALVTEIAAVDVSLSGLAAQWGKDNGYCVRATPEMMLRALAK